MSNKPLTKRQIAVLSIMAGKAYKRIQSQGCPLPSLTDWRHDEVWAATGITESLTKATQEHYVPIYNRLASYLGCAPVKDRTWSEMDKAIHLLDDAMQRYEITPGTIRGPQAGRRDRPGDLRAACPPRHHAARQAG